MLDAILAALEPYLPTIIDALVDAIVVAIMGLVTWVLTYLPPYFRGRIEAKHVAALEAAITRYVRAEANATAAEVEHYLRTTLPEAVKRMRPSRSFVDLTMRGAKWA